MVKKGMKGGVIGVRWDDDDDYVTSHWSHVEPVVGKMNQSAHTILANIVMATSMKIEDDDAHSKPMPRWFFQCLIRDDWRNWVEAAKRENLGWEETNAVTEVDIKSVDYNTKIIPLAELYSIKRDGRYKLRQIALGNLLRHGVHYGDTWSTCITGTGIRLFYGLATAMGLPVREGDVATAYLRSDRVTTMHAYKPSHYGFSDREMDDIALLRIDLLKLVKEEGEEGLTRLCRKMANTKNAETVLKLNVPVYGEPDAGHRFAVKMNATLVDVCGLRRCRSQPSMYVQYYYKPQRDQNGDKQCIGHIFCITWSDDFRYFGTDSACEKFKLEFGDTDNGGLPCEFSDESNEFVSIETKQDLANGTCELTQCKYWETAVEDVYSVWFPKGPRTRRMPLPAGTVIVPAADDEFEVAKHLPMKAVLGTLGFPAQHTKLEIRHALRMVQKHGHKWNETIFGYALNILEYCYTTRKMGVIFSKDLDKHGVNILYAYADASLQSPKCVECAFTMMNGAIVSGHWGDQSIQADSTMKAEFMAAYRASNDVIALRTLMGELGFDQNLPTILYEDNQPCIHTATNPGAVQKKSKTFDLQYFTLRDRVIDKLIAMQYCNTLKQLSDIGTKLLPTAQFEFLRDLMNGYALVRASGNYKSLPVGIITLADLTK